MVVVAISQRKLRLCSFVPQSNVIPNNRMDREIGLLDGRQGIARTSVGVAERRAGGTESDSTYSAAASHAYRQGHPASYGAAGPGTGAHAAEEQPVTGLLRRSR